ncbi:hypothetical protein ACUIJN_22420 [Metabacillus halosaccharovorans]
MGDLIKFNNKPREISLGHRKEKLNKRTEEINKKLGELKTKKENLHK